MKTDEMQVLRDFRRDVPVASDEAVRRAYAHATRQSYAARWPRRLALETNRGRILAVAATAAAVALVGFFAIPDMSPHPGHSRTPIAGALGGSELAAANPIPLSDASSALGAPLILPDTSLLTSSDADATAYEQWCSSSSPSAADFVCQVSVNFPAQSVQIVYSLAAAQWPPQYQNYVTDPLALYQSEMQNATNPDRRIVNLSGVPAFLAGTKDPDNEGSLIQFRLGKYAVNIGAQSYTLAETQELAQSMVDQANSTSP